MADVGDCICSQVRWEGTFEAFLIHDCLPLDGGHGGSENKVLNPTGGQIKGTYFLILPSLLGTDFVNVG